MQDIRMDCVIFQYNCQRSYAVVCELGESMCRSECRFALVQEPYSTSGRVRGLPAFMRVFTDIGANAAVVVNDVSVECMVLGTTQWGVCVLVEGRFGRMFLASVYCRYGADLAPYLGYLDELLVLAGDVPLIVGMDANAVSPMWFSKMSGRASGQLNYTRGLVLSEWILARDVYVLNVASEWYTFDGPNGRSDIDVTIVNRASIRAFGFEWRVTDRGISDHNLLEVVVSWRGSVGDSVSVRRWRVRDIDWSAYGECLRGLAGGVSVAQFSALGVGEQVGLISEWVGQVNDVFMGRCRRRNRRGVVWWTDELTAMRRDLRRSRRRYQRARARSSVDVGRESAEYRRKLRAYKDEVVRVKEAEWRDFVDRNRDDPWGRVYRVCRGKNRCVEVSGLKVDGRFLASWRECVSVLLGAFFPGAGRAVPPLMGGVADPPPLEDWMVAESVSACKSRKSPGMDGMTGEMCKCIFRVMPEYLMALYSKCVSMGCFPSEWKVARVVVLVKAPDRVRSDPGSYRGISLLPVLGKVLERVMVGRLQEVMSEDVCEWQFGFRKGKSVEDAWMYVGECVSGSRSRYVLGVFIDFKGAFDYLCWASVLDRLRQVGCPDYGLWADYFADRRACIVGVNETVCVNVTRGCPQGSISGPFIWNLMMDPLLRALGSLCKVCAYADDLLVMVEGETRADIERLADEAMRVVNDWGESVGVSVAVGKTVTMLLKGRLSSTRHPCVTLNGAAIRYVTEVKYLGVTVGERMSFGVHLDRVREKLTGVVGQVRRVLRSEWGLSRRAVRVIYDGLFVACATYCASVWYEAVRSVVGCRKILSCQRVMLLGCVPVCRTVSTEALQVLVGKPPLDLEVVRMSVSYRLKRGVPLGTSDWRECMDIGGMSVAERKVFLRECVIRRWQQRWDESPKGRVTYGFVRDVGFVGGRSDFTFGLCVGFLLTGHGSLNAFLFRRGLSDTSGCGCGAEFEDWMHVLCECPNYADIRDLARMGVIVNDGVYDVSGVLSVPGGFGSLAEFAGEVFRRRRRIV